MFDCLCILLKEMKITIESLTSRNKEFEEANLRQQSTINKLLDEKKENELKIKRLKHENEKLKLSKPLDLTKWREWKTDEVFKFFMNMFDDNTLEPYVNKIESEIFGGGYSGEDILDIEKKDLKETFGILNIKIRNNVWGNIQQLINQNKKSDNNNQNDCEGANVSTAYI